MGLALVAATLTLDASCGKRSDRGESSKEDAGPSADELLRRQWQSTIQAEASRTYERPPLYDPAVPGESSEDYLPAVAFDPSFEIYQDAMAVLSGRMTWKDAPEELKAFAVGDPARNAAEGFVRGASRTRGKSVAPMRSDVMSVIVGSPNEVVRIVAFADAQNGQVHRACRYLLALQRFLQDLKRGAPVAGALIARTYQSSSLALLRRLATAPELSDDQLRDIVTTYGKLVATRVPVEESLRVEILFLAAEELRRPLRAGEPESSRTARLERLRAQRAVVEELAKLPARTLAKRAAFFEEQICALDDTDEACKNMSRYLVELNLAEAHFLATYVYLALALDLRERGALAPALAAMVPDVVPSLPDDPITGEPFELAIVDGKRVIRRGATSLDSAPDAEPRSIPAPRGSTSK